MKRLLLLMLLLITATQGFSQSKGISYQAVILNPNPQEIPGANAQGNILANSAVSIQFSIINSSGTEEYQEQHSTRTDRYGMINLLIGTGAPTGSTDFSDIFWDGTVKKLKVAIDFKGGGNFSPLSEQNLTYMPQPPTQETTIEIAGNTAAIATERTRAINAEQANATGISTLKTEQTTQNAAIALNTAKVGITPEQASTIGNTTGINTGDQDISGIAINAGAITTLQAEQTTQNTAIALNTAKTGITTAQAGEISANTLKTGITTQQASDITGNNAKVGITTVQANAIVANTTKTGITTAQATAIAANTLKTGITSQQASDITANNAKVGITTAQASDITANNAKVSDINHVAASTTTDLAEGTNLYYTDARVSENTNVVANTAKTGITSQQTSDITANNAKVGITAQQTSDITANNAKVGITTVQADAIVTNTAKTGITSQQASDITANNDKVGITTVQADAIVANTAKVSYPGDQDLSGLATTTALNLKANIASPTLTGTTTINDLVIGSNYIALGSGTSHAPAYSVAIGANSGNTNPGTYSVSLGAFAGETSPSPYAVSLGAFAGKTTPATYAMSLGAFAGETSKGTGSIAIGAFAGKINQGNYAIALGMNAGKTNQNSNSIILNASGAEINAATSGFFVNPIRSATGSSSLFYDTTTKEITYGGAVTKTQIGLGNVENTKVNLSATIAPDVTDDTASGYSVGSRWIDVTNDKEYVCVDATATAAVWIETTGGSSSNYAGTSTTSIDLSTYGDCSFQYPGCGSGTVTLTTNEVLAYTAGMRVRLAETSNPTTQYLEGMVSTYDGSAMEINVDGSYGGVIGTTSSNWTINLGAGLPGVPGPVGERGEGYGGISVTSNDVSLGVKDFTLDANYYAYNIGMRVRFSNSATDYVEGIVTSYETFTSVLTLTVDHILGAGTFTDWTVGIAGDPATVGSANLGEVLILGNDANGNNIVNTGKIGIGTATPNAQSSMEIATPLPVIFPSMTQTQVNAITVPVEGMVQFNSDAHKLQVYAMLTDNAEILNEIYIGNESGQGGFIVDQSFISPIDGQVIAVELMFKDASGGFPDIDFMGQGNYTVPSYSQFTWHTFILTSPMPVTAGVSANFGFIGPGVDSRSFATNSNYPNGSIMCCLNTPDNDVLFRVHIQPVAGSFGWQNMH